MAIDSAAVLILLLMAAVALGWLAARWQRQAGESRYRRVNAEYFKGLNFLLNEQPDKAIEVFIRMAEVDSDTVETHFALGSLFRRRGEVDRAIRIHQNLIARPSLSREYRSQALYELAQDYLRAGLLDRAESILLELLDAPSYTEAALISLVSLYEQQKDWAQAIAMRRRLQAVTRVSEQQTIAQYFCEMAQSALNSQDRNLAMRFLKRAQAHDPRCVRAQLLLAQMAEDAQDWERSERHYRRALEQEIRFATDVLPSLARVSRRLEGQTSLDQILTELRRSNPQAVPYLAIAAILDPQLDDPVSRECVEEYLCTEPSLRSLYEMFTRFSGTGGAAAGADLRPLQAAVRSLLSMGPRYRCEQCGFRGKTLYWQCPSCKTWNSTKPFHEIVLAAAQPVAAAQSSV